MKTLTDKQRIKHMLWLSMSVDVHHYLMSNSEGRLDGSEKYNRHKNLIDLYVAGKVGCELDSCFDYIEYWEAIHDKTQELTGYMDEVIGFPITGRPDYDDLAPKFFKEFIKLCDEVPYDAPITRSTISNGIIEAPDSVTPWYSQCGKDSGNVYVSFAGFYDGFGVSHELHKNLRELPTNTKFKLVLEVKNG